MSLELTKLQFNNDNYFYSVLKSIELPRRSQWYSNIEAYFETLFSFKVSSTVRIMSFNSLFSNGYRFLLSSRLGKRIMATSYPYMINALDC